MQKEPKPGTPKLSNTRRPRNPGTPDNRMRNGSGDITMSTINRTTNLRQRMTMAPGEIMIPSAIFTRRKMGNTVRLNTTISQAQMAQVPLKGEIDSSENELGLLYDKYLQAKATEIIMKKKIDEKERMMNIQMAAVSKEKNIVKDKFEKAKLRENDIKYSNIMQLNIDSQTNQITNCFDDLRRNKIKEKLLELKTLLEPLDELRCQGIIVPENTEDIEDLFKSLEEIDDVLIRILEANGDKGKVYKNIENGLNNLIHKHGEIECVKKKFDELLCGLQVLVLKDASNSLSQNYVDEFN